MFRIDLEPKRVAATDFIGSVRRDLKQAIADSGMTTIQIAQKIGVYPNFLFDELNGGRDITVGRIAEICWAIGCDVEINIVE
jgi:hypothetical protein